VTHRPALIADGYHARTDGIVSLAVVASAIAVALGVKVADPLIGLAISLVILRITWQSFHTVKADPGLGESADEHGHAHEPRAGVARCAWAHQLRLSSAGAGGRRQRRTWLATRSVSAAIAPSGGHARGRSPGACWTDTSRGTPGSRC
jgi:Co/Zn/Cd efflux system component